MRQVPVYSIHEYDNKINDYCVFVFVINEGEKLLSQLERMQPVCKNVIDIVVADGGSTDGSTEEDKLRSRGVNTLLVKNDTGKLGSQMRMAFDWALKRGYKGVVCIDGNGKDGVEAIPDFVKALQDGVDHVQGSRFVKGGHHENTPLSRLLGVKILHAPLLSLVSGFRYTDTTNGFRGYSAELLASEEINIFRDCFTGYELHYYLAVEAAKGDFKCREIPVTRIYPKNQKVPTKINSFRGKVGVLENLFDVAMGKYCVPQETKRFSLKKVILLFLALFICWGICSYKFLPDNDYDEWSEGLVFSSLIVKEQGLQPWYGSPMFSVREVKKVSDITPKERVTPAVGRYIYQNPEWKNSMLEDTVLRKYEPQLGLAAVIYNLVAKTGFDSFRQLRYVNSLLIGICLALIGVYLVWIFGYPALVGSLLIYPYLSKFSGNLYWCYYTMLIPIAILCLAHMFGFFEERKKRRIVWILYGVALFFRCGFGFEYYPCIIIISCIPVMLWNLYSNKGIRHLICNIFTIFCISVISIVASFIALGCTLGLDGVLDSVLRRTVGTAQNWEMFRSGFAPFTYIPDQILSMEFGRFLAASFIGYLFCWIVMLFLQYFRIIKVKQNLLACFFMFCILFLSIFSWAVLAKPHVIIHAWLLSVLGLFLVLPFLWAGIIAFLYEIFKVRFIRVTAVTALIAGILAVLFLMVNNCISTKKTGRNVANHFEVVEDNAQYTIFVKEKWNRGEDVYLFYTKTCQSPGTVEFTHKGRKITGTVGPFSNRLSNLLPVRLKRFIVYPYKKIHEKKEKKTE